MPKSDSDGLLIPSLVFLFSPSAVSVSMARAGGPEWRVQAAQTRERRALRCPPARLRPASPPSAGLPSTPATPQRRPAAFPEHRCSSGPPLP